MNFKEFLNGGRVILDGAMGTELIKRGYMRKTELLNVENPSVLTEIAAAYVAAGSDCVTANTFGCNRFKADLSVYTLEELIEGGVRAARASGAKYVLYDCGPTGELLKPSGRLSFEEAYEAFKEQAVAAEKAGCDGALIETMGDLKELRCALLSFKENTSLPVICSMSFDENGRTFLGASAECFTLTAQALGADAVGANCGLGPDKALPVLKKIAGAARVPVMAKPNAGLPVFKDGKTYYDMDAPSFGTFIREIAKSGVSLLGGCCGTDPEFIKIIKQETKDIPAVTPSNVFDGVCSYARTADFNGFVKIGERVNPTNRPLLKNALKDRDYDFVLGLCLAQREEGADMLDFNVGMAGIDEAEVLSQAIEATQGVAALPICIDTSKKEALERALRIYDGVALINSVNGEEQSMSRVLPLAAKYGAYVIALCLDENGIPSDAAGRLAIADKIAERAERYGVGRERLLFDPLTMAVSVNALNGKILFDVLDGLAERGLKTVIGLSNISFGLPARSKLNGALLRLARERGVTAAIVNPTLAENDDETSENLLLGREENCDKFIRENADALPEAEVKTELSIKECVARGLTGEGMKRLKSELTKENADYIMEEEIIGGLNILGERYEKQTVFLPGLIAGSETAKAMLDYVKSVCFSGESAGKATVVIATVKGDVHDIGKNIVKTVAANYGYRMIDLGRDVSTERIMEAVEEFHPQAVALSALMTTTLDNMTETVREVKRVYPNMYVLVGGAVVTADYAESVGAIYTKDAREASVMLETLFAKGAKN